MSDNMLNILQGWSTAIHSQNVKVGWWDNVPEEELQKVLLCLEKAQLICTEIAEATEGARKDLMDDHLPHRKMEEVELADALIRALDLAGFLGVNLKDFLEEEGFEETTFDDEIRKMVNELDEEQIRVGALHMSLTKLVTDWADDHFSADRLLQLLGGLVGISQHRGYDIMAAMEEKVAYNANRADHKRENREKEGGKNF